MLKQVALLFCLLPAAAVCRAAEITVPDGTPLPVKIDGHAAMRVGTALRGHLLYPVFADNQVVLPAGTVVHGTVTALRPDRTRRIHARFNADFTPFYIPVVHFDTLTLPSGEELAFVSTTATDGAPILRIVPPARKTGNIFSRGVANLWQVAKDDVAIFTGPELGDRFTQFLYSQLPYHPQRIEKDTAWTVETSQPFQLASAAEPAPAAPTALVPSNEPWLLQAYLAEPLSSASSKPGEHIRAIVAEPVFNADRSIAVPQGAVLLGTVTRSKSARSFARAGVLRFEFQQIQLPDGQTSSVQAALKGVDSNEDQLLDAEGQVKPKPQDKVIVPLLLSALALRPLRNGGRHPRIRDAVASNGGGLIGRVVGTASGSANLAAGIGFYQVAVSTYNRWIAHGKQVTFAKDTRVVIQTTARRSGPLRPVMQTR